jgi:hypothetical protein
MSYTIKKSDGTTLATVPENDIVLDKASVALVGRGATNYGVAHSQNFVQLLENFAHTSPPAHPLEGQLWYDKTIGALKVYKGDEWVIVGGSGGTGTGGGGGGGGGDGGGPGGDTIGGPILVTVGNTTILVLIAAGRVIGAVSHGAIPTSALPATITVFNTQIALQSRFPFGLKPGMNLATDPIEYTYTGRVLLADQSIFAGGGMPFAASTFCDLGPTSVTLHISNDNIIGAFSRVAVPNSSLPTNFTVNGISMPFRTAFPNGLRAGLTMAAGMGISTTNITITDGSGGGGGSGSSVTIELVSEMIGVETEARATAISTLYTYVSNTYAEAGKITELEATFKNATGQTSLAAAIEWLIVTAGEGTANAEAGVMLRAEITNAITGATSFAHALQLLNAKVTENSATASDLTALESRVTNAYTTAISTATQNLLTQATLTGALAQFKTDLNIEFESETGYTSFAAAVNDLKVSGDGGGATAAFDTDLRTRLTNALPGSTIDAAMTALSNYDPRINSNLTNHNDLVSALKQLTGTGAQQSTATAVQQLASQSFVNGAIATSKTQLTATYVQAMNEVTGGTSTTFGSAIADVIATASSDGSGSTSSIDTTLRNLFISLTHEASHPVTTVSQAIEKLMTQTTADRALASRATQLEGIFTNGLNTTLGSASQALSTVATNASSASTFSTQLQSSLVTQTGQSSWSNAVSYLATRADLAGTASTKVNTIESAFQTSTGISNVSTAIQTMWTKANETGSVAGWGFELNAGNQIVGMQALANSATKVSSISMRADNFRFWHPNTAEIVPFEIVGNEVRIRNLMIGDGTLGYQKLETISFTTQVYMTNITVGTGGALASGGLSFGTGVMPAGSKVVVFFSGNCTGSDNGGMYANIIRSGANGSAYLQGTAEFGNPDEGGSAQTWIWTDTVPADGSYTYTVHGAKFGTTVLRNAHLIGMIQRQSGPTSGSASGSNPPPTGGDYYYPPDGGGGGGTPPEGGTIHPN